MPQKVPNNAITTLQTTIINTDTSLTLVSATNWPSSLAAGEYLIITLVNGSTREIIKATTISTVTVSGITRGQQGTTATGFPAGSTVMVAVDRDIMEAIFDEREAATLTAVAAVPATPSTGFTKFYSRVVCGRTYMAYVDPFGQEQLMPPTPFFRRLWRWWPTTTTGFGSDNLAPTTAATLSHVTPATTNISTIQYGTTFSCSTTAGNASGARDPLSTIWFGNSAGRGGFHFRCRFGTGLIALSGGQIIVGLASAPGALAGEPSAVTDVLAVTKDAADTNLFFSRRTGAGTVQKVDLGVASAVNLVFDVEIFAPPNSGTVWVRVLQVNFDGTFTSRLDTSYNTFLPANTTLLGRTFQVRNGTTAAANSIIHFHSSIESNV